MSEGLEPFSRSSRLRTRSKAGTTHGHAGRQPLNFLTPVLNAKVNDESNKSRHEQKCPLPLPFCLKPYGTLPCMDPSSSACQTFYGPYSPKLQNYTNSSETRQVNKSTKNSWKHAEIIEKRIPQAQQAADECKCNHPRLHPPPKSRQPRTFFTYDHGITAAQVAARQHI